MSSHSAGMEPIDLLVAGVLQSARYRHVCAAAVRRIGQVEIDKRRSLKDAVKETKNRLHQIGGAYLDAPPPYGKWTSELQSAPDSDACRSVLRHLMLCHASTRERLPVLEEFYKRTLAPAGAIRSVLDIASGLNPLAVPWMGLEDGARYEAFDLYGDMMAFVQSALRSPNFQPRVNLLAEARDVGISPPESVAEIAIVLKFLPLLEQSGEQGMLTWLQRLKTRFVLVSFPTRTLGGRDIGMAGNYESRFREVLQAAGWSAERTVFPTELCYLAETQANIYGQES